MIEWRKSLLEELKGFAAPRVVSMKDLTEMAERVRPGVHRQSVYLLSRAFEDGGTLLPVRRGLWLNASAFPAPSVAEAASRIRSGAVVSLQTVLGDAGVLNNFASQVYCVLPVPEKGPNPSLAPVDAADTRIHFRGMRQDVLEAGDREDRLNPLVPYPRATAEAALVHWFYLAHVQRSQMEEPDTQCDVSMLDLERLARLAAAAGVADEAAAWVERCRRREEDDAQERGWGP